jgi:undecaprenyl-diphosphatase
MSAAENHQGGNDPHDPVHHPVETVIEVVDEVTSAPPPPWSRALTAHLTGFDEAVDARFDRHLRGRPVIDRGMYSITELADFSLLWHLLGSARALRSDADLRDAIRTSTVLGIEQTLVNAGLKSLFRRERPIPDFERPHHLRVPMTSSFPSGHASAAFCAATLLSDGRSRTTKAAWFALATVVASSRVHVKIHHASDVIGGATVGLVAGQIAKRLWRR